MSGVVPDVENPLKLEEEAVEQQREKPIEDVCENMLEKVFDYFNGELTATCEDYKLLQNLNDIAVSKYQDMSKKANTLTSNMASLNQKYKALQPFLEQIDHLEEGVEKLEVAAHKLDAYSKKLETKFKKLEKR